MRGGGTFRLAIRIIFEVTVVSRISKSLKSLIKKLALLLNVNYILVALSNRPIVLGYHRVVEPKESLLIRRIGAVSPIEFSAHLAYLARIGCAIKPLNEVLKSNSARHLALTFDDGFKDLYESAFPLLKARGVPFTLFVITSTIDSKTPLWQHRIYELMDGLEQGDRARVLREAIIQVSDESVSKDIEEMRAADEILSYMIASMGRPAMYSILRELERNLGFPTTVSRDYLSAQELKEMCAEGLRLESHGHEHWNLCNLTTEELDREILDSLSVVRSYNQGPFAYSVAHGRADASVLSAIRSHACQVILTGEFGDLAGVRRLEIPRVWPHGSVTDFSWLLTKLLLASILGRARRDTASGLSPAQ